MRKWLCSIVAAVLLLTGSQAAFAAGSDSVGKQIILQVNNTEMIVNGTIVDLDASGKVSPIIRQGRTLLPIANVVREFGGTASWDGTERKVEIKLGANQVVLWIDKKQALVNGKSTTLDVAPAVINGKTMVPLRFVSENTGIKLFWHGKNQVISLFYHENPDSAFWFEGDHVKRISDTRGLYTDGGAFYSVEYPVEWGDPYVIFDEEGLEYDEYSYLTVFYDLDGAMITGQVHSLQPGETMAQFLESTGRVSEEGDLYYGEVVEDVLSSGEEAYFYFYGEDFEDNPGAGLFIAELIVPKGNYVVILQLYGDIEEDFEKFESSSAFQQFFEQLIPSFTFEEGAGAAG